MIASFGDGVLALGASLMCSRTRIFWMDSNALVGGGDDVDVVWHHVLLRDLKLCNWDTHDDGINRAAPSQNSQHQQENE